MGGCCCCASKGPELNNSAPIYHHPRVPPQAHHPLSSTSGTVSSVSAGLLVDTNLDTSIPVTFRSPPTPVPYETYAGRPQGSHGGKSEPLDRSVADMNSGSIQVGSVKAVEADGVTNSNVEITSAKEEMEDEDLKKATEPFDTSLLEEEDVCPTCLEEYDKENPKIITQCEHHFHLACILEWMERSDTCPVCDKEMVFTTTDGS